MSYGKLYRRVASQARVAKDLGEQDQVGLAADQRGGEPVAYFLLAERTVPGLNLRTAVGGARE